jgi:hypothetical protein
MTRFIFDGFRAAKEVLKNSTLICTASPWSWQLHGDLELGCLFEKLVGVVVVQLWSHAKHLLSLYMITVCRSNFKRLLKISLLKLYIGGSPKFYCPKIIPSYSSFSILISPII